MMSAEINECKEEASLGEKEKSSKPKKVSAKPSMQIYQPPGLRSMAAPIAPVKSSLSKEGDADQVSVASSDSRSSNQSDQQQAVKLVVTKMLSRPHSASNPSVFAKGSRAEESEAKIVATSFIAKQVPAKDLVRPHFMNEKQLKKKPQFSQNDMNEIVGSLDKLGIGKDKGLVDQFVAGGMIDENLARRLAQCLVHYAIEESRQSGRKVSRLCASLLECPSGAAFHSGFITSIAQYFECRDQLRSDHLKVWIGFLNFVSDLYSSVGFTYEGGLVDTIFNIFDYMLTKPILESLKIEELESLIASLLGVGYDLERNCPDQLVCLKNLIRDAFVEVNEPWARKMIMLLMELGASGWSLPPEANEYYFQ